MRKAYILALLIFMVAWSCSLMMADPIQITAGVNTLGLCVTNCDFTPNPLVQNNIGVYSVSGTGEFNEELIVLLVPDNGGASASTSFFSSDPISSVNVYNPYPGTGVTGTGTSKLAPSGTFGLGSGTATQVSLGYWGEITGSSGSTKVGDFLGVGLSSSINMSNVSSESGFNFGSGTPTFGVYTLLANATVDGNGLLDVGLSSDMPIGTFVTVEACEVTQAATTNCIANPNSSAGVAKDAPPTTVPEPASLALVGTGLLGFAFLVRRKFARSS